MVPRDQEDSPTTCCFFNLAEKKVHKMKNTGIELGDNSWCVGSSHGWLVILDKEANTFVIDPFRGAQIELPLVKELCSLSNNNQYFVNQLQRNFIQKAILLSNPSRCNSFIVVVIYGIISRIAFCQNGDSSWTELDGINNQFYSDIICHNDLLYALTENGVVEVWDFEIASSPIKRRSIEPSPSAKMVEARDFYRELHSTRCYLVESSGDLLLVVRFIGNFVNEEGKPLAEAELLSDEDTHPLICPYWTLMFHVYKLDFDQCKWVEVETLTDDDVLFLGGNHSMSLSAREFPEFEGNSVYFTDDNWEQMNEDYLYGGHHIGFFNLQEKSVKSFYECGLGTIEPPPFWVVPNLLGLKEIHWAYGLRNGK